MCGSLVQPADRWISLAFQAGSRDKFSGYVRMTRRCRAHVPYVFFILLLVHTLHRQTGQHQLTTYGKKKRARTNGEHTTTLSKTDTRKLINMLFKPRQTSSHDSPPLK